MTRRLGPARNHSIHIASGGGEAEARGLAERTIAAYATALDEPSG
jgi:hypothetical protein